MKTLLCFVTIKRPVRPNVNVCVCLLERESWGGDLVSLFCIISFLPFPLFGGANYEHFLFTLRPKLLRNKDRNYTIPMDKVGKTKHATNISRLCFQCVLVASLEFCVSSFPLKMAEIATKTYRQLNHGESPRKPKMVVLFHGIQICGQNISLVSAVSDTLVARSGDQDARLPTPPPPSTKNKNKKNQLCVIMHVKKDKSKLNNEKLLHSAC